MSKTFTLFLVSLISCYGEDIYVAQTAQGADTGVNAANAHSMVWFNTVGNWDTDVSADGKIGPGDTLHFTGTITSAANIQESGSAGNRITLKIDTGAKFSSPVWSIDGAINAFSKNYINIEGSNPQAGDGIIVQTDIENTNNGTNLGVQTTQTRHILTDGSCSDITVRNLVSRNVYVRPYAHPTDTAGGGTNISLRGNDNLVIENCYMDNSETSCNVVGNNIDGINTGLVINNNWIMDCANGPKMSTGTNAIVQGGRITRNRIDHMARWNTTTGAYHNDGIQTIGDAAGSSLRDLHIAYNHIGPHQDVVGGEAMTASIYVQYNATGVKCYNNFIETLPGVHHTNDIITIGNTPVENGQAFAERHLIVNNTIMGPSGAMDKGIHGGFSDISGNVVQNVEFYVSIHNTDTGNPSLNAIGNRNVYFGSASPSACFWVRTGPGTGFPSFAQWQALGYDAQGVVANPLLNADGTLQEGSPAIGFAPTQTIFTDDFNGNPRTGSWDAGAFEFGAAIPVYNWQINNLRATTVTVDPTP